MHGSCIQERIYVSSLNFPRHTSLNSFQPVRIQGTQLSCPHSHIYTQKRIIKPPIPALTSQTIILTLTSPKTTPSRNHRSHFHHTQDHKHPFSSNHPRLAMTSPIPFHPSRPNQQHISTPPRRRLSPHRQYPLANSHLDLSHLHHNNIPRFLSAASAQPRVS
jgi:hypothetical protein